jgi:hypothetical protein
VLELDGSPEIYKHDGTDALYCNGGGTSGCSQCHTDQGFVPFITSGGWTAGGNQLGATPVDAPEASPPGCFTCHKPHETGDFSLRTQAAVTLVDGVTSFNGGMGNLCVSCHKARTPVDKASTTTTISPGVTATDTTAQGSLNTLISSPTFTATTTKPTLLQAWSSSSGAHHGPQSDFIEGVNNWKYTGKTDYTYMQHLTGATDTCVTCHMYGFVDLDAATAGDQLPTGRLGGNLESGGHGWYLTSSVHGTKTDLIAECKTCHKTGGTGNPWPTTAAATTFDASGHTSGDIDGDGTTSDILVEVEHLKDKLLTYYGNHSNFLTIAYTISGLDSSKKQLYTGYTIAATVAGQAPVVSAANTGADYTTGGTGTDTWDWHKDWEFNPVSAPAIDYPGTTLAVVALNKWQSQSFWNLKLFMDDKSGGVHNPKFAARILFDALQNLKDKGVAGITLGTRP